MLSLLEEKTNCFFHVTLLSRKYFEEVILWFGEIFEIRLLGLSFVLSQSVTAFLRVEPSAILYILFSSAGSLVLQL